MPQRVITRNFSQRDDVAQLMQERRKKKAAKKNLMISCVFTLVLVFAMAAFIFARFNTLPDAPEHLQTVTVARGDFVSYVDVNGVVEPLTEMEVWPSLTGVVSGCEVGVGSAVEEGDVLFTLSNADLNRSVQLAKSEYERALGALSIAEGQRDELQVKYDEAMKEYESAVESYERELIDYSADPEFGTPPVEPKITNPSSMESSLLVARQQVQSAQQAVDAASDTLTLAQDDLERCTAVAPISGIVTECNISEGFNTVGLVSYALKIMDSSQLNISAKVGEGDINKIAIGEYADICIESVSSDARYPGEVLETSSSPSQPVAGAVPGTSAATYDVVIGIWEKSDSMKPGMKATVSIETQRIVDAALVPNEAIQSDGERTYLLVVGENGETQEVDIEVVDSDESVSVIEGEINEGAEIVVLAA